MRGANLPSLIWDVMGSVITAGDATRMAGWGANVVRIGLNQGFWLEGATGCDARCYRENVLRVVGGARDAGLDVILDLHWATAGGLVPPQFMEMPDTHSLQFWSEVAAAFASDGRVHFDLYNEPHDVDWTIWRQRGSGGASEGEEGTSLIGGYVTLGSHLAGLAPAPGLVVHAGTCAFGEPEIAPSMYSISKHHSMFIDDPELPFAAEIPRRRERPGREQ